MKQTSIPPAERARQMVLAVEFDVDELACRILEAQHEMSRPDNVSATEALDTMPPMVQNDFRRCAMVAMEYFEEQVIVSALIVLSPAARKGPISAYESRI